MLLIELISISNMGVSLIKTCFCSRLYEEEEIHYDCVSNDFDGKSWCPRQLDENRYPIQGNWITCPTEKCSGFL